MPVHRVGQTCVGLDNHRQPGGPADLLHHGQQPVRAQGTVYAHRVGSKALQGTGHGLSRAAGEGAACFVKAHGHEGGKGCVFLDGQQRGPGLVQVGHGFDGNQIGPGGFTRPGHFGKKVVGILKAQGSKRLQQLAQGAHVQGHQSGVSCCAAGYAYCGGNNLLHGVARPGQLEGVGPEGVGINHLTARVHIGPVDAAYPVGVGQAEQFRPLARLQPLFLQHGAHGTVQIHDPLSVKRHSRIPPFAWCIDCAARSRRSRGCAPFAALRPGR